MKKIELIYCDGSCVNLNKTNLSSLVLRIAYGKHFSLKLELGGYVFSSQKVAIAVIVPMEFCRSER